MHDDPPWGIAGFDTTILPLLFVLFKFRQLLLTSSMTAPSISSKPSISLADTAETMRSQAQRKVLMLVYLGTKLGSGQFLAICPAGPKPLANI